MHGDFGLADHSDGALMQLPVSLIIQLLKLLLPRQTGL